MTSSFTSYFRLGEFEKSALSERIPLLTHNDLNIINDVSGPKQHPRNHRAQFTMVPKVHNDNEFFQEVFWETLKKESVQCVEHEKVLSQLIKLHSDECNNLFFSHHIVTTLNFHCILAL